LPELAGTLGIFFVAALQTSSFPKVEAWSYSSVMATSNFRQSIQALFAAAVAGNAEANGYRRPYVFGGICIAFGIGAALGALTTEQVPAYTLALPVAMLVIVLFHCERRAAPMATHQRPHAIPLA
jgi:uncharacterized membrane protein YoaK (UPF0700 family)